MFSREPVAIAALVRAVILCAVAFGLKWTPDQIASVMLVVELGLALLTRSSVTPVATLPPGVAGQIADAKNAAKVGG